MPSDTIEDINHVIAARKANELVSYKPGFWVNASLYVFLGMILLMTGAAFLIHTTDTIEAEVRLTSVNAPRPVAVQTESRLMKLLLQEGDSVQAGSVIGCLEATASAAVVLRLDAQIHCLQQSFHGEEGVLLHSVLSQHPDSLGELQHAWQLLMNQYLVYKSYSGDGFFTRKLLLLQKDILNKERLRERLKERRGLAGEDLILSEKTFAANTSLKNDKVLSEAEYRTEQSKLIGKKAALPEMESLLIANAMEADEKQKEILELEHTIQNQRLIFFEALHTFASALSEWKKLHLLIAPAAGRLAFPDFVQENQLLKLHQVVCFVKAANSSCIAEVLIPQKNFGKVAVGQRVQLYFRAYPYQEYGFVNTRIEFISGISSDSGYMAKLMFPGGLITSMHKRIPYRDDLKATGKIITRKTRLIDRLLNPLRSAMAAL